MCMTYAILMMYCKCVEILPTQISTSALDEKKEETKKTYSVFISNSPMIDFYENISNGSISRVERNNLDIAIMDVNGLIMGLWEFTDKTEKSWKEVLQNVELKFKTIRSTGLIKYVCCWLSLF